MGILAVRRPLEVSLRRSIGLPISVMPMSGLSMLGATTRLAVRVTSGAGTRSLEASEER